MQDAVMQDALPDIDRLLIDIDAIQRRRDCMVSVCGSKDTTCVFLRDLLAAAASAAD